MPAGTVDVVDEILSLVGDQSWSRARFSEHLYSFQVGRARHVVDNVQLVDEVVSAVRRDGSRKHPDINGDGKWKRPGGLSDSGFAQRNAHGEQSQAKSAASAVHEVFLQFSAC